MREVEKSAVVTEEVRAKVREKELSMQKKAGEDLLVRNKPINLKSML